MKAIVIKRQKVHGGTTYDSLVALGYTRDDDLAIARDVAAMIVTRLAANDDSAPTFEVEFATEHVDLVEFPLGDIESIGNVSLWAFPETVGTSGDTKVAMLTVDGGLVPVALFTRWATLEKLGLTFKAEADVYYTGEFAGAYIIRTRLAEAYAAGHRPAFATGDLVAVKRGGSINAGTRGAFHCWKEGQVARVESIMCSPLVEGEAARFCYFIKLTDDKRKRDYFSRNEDRLGAVPEGASIGDVVDEKVVLTLEEKVAKFVSLIDKGIARVEPRLDEARSPNSESYLRGKYDALLTVRECLEGFALAERVGD